MTRNADEVFSRILETIREAQTAFNNLVSSVNPRDTDYRDEQEGTFKHLLEGAFLKLRVFLEVHDLPHFLETVKADHAKALSNPTESELSPWGEPYSLWAVRVRQLVDALSTTLGSASQSIVTKDLIEILRATVYSITDTGCFHLPPQNETDVHVRIEAVLRCVFPTLRHKPPISKPIKNFQPDTGLPDTHTLIEYKFVTTPDDVKRVADEVLADTMGYSSQEWNQFIYVIYETRRLKSEEQWKELLRTSAVGEDTQIIVISGEPPSIRSAVSQRTSAKRHKGRLPT